MDSGPYIGDRCINIEIKMMGGRERKRGAEKKKVKQETARKTPNRSFVLNN